MGKNLTLYLGRSISNFNFRQKISIKDLSQHLF